MVRQSFPSRELWHIFEFKKINTMNSVKGGNLKVWRTCWAVDRNRRTYSENVAKHFHDKFRTERRYIGEPFVLHGVQNLPLIF